MILLGVNIDHCATVRQARYRDAAGAEGGDGGGAAADHGDLVAQ